MVPSADKSKDEANISKTQSSQIPPSGGGGGFTYVSHTLIRFTHNKTDYCLQYGGEYSNLPADSSIIKNLIDQKRLIKI